MMRFYPKPTRLHTERVGVLSGFIQSPSISIETPTSAVFTKGASIVHLTAETVAKVFPSPQLLWIPLSSSIQLESGAKALGEGVAKFAGLPTHVTCLTFNDLNEKTPSGHFENDMLPLWTRNGKKKFSAQRYMDVMAVFKPDIIVALADSRTSLTEGHKRIIKSVERSCNLLDECVSRYKGSTEFRNSGLIGVIVGHGHTKEFKHCLERVLLHKDTLLGIALSGLSCCGEDSISITAEDVEPIFKMVSESVPPEMLRILEGCWNPAVVVSAIQHGWDVFDGSYPARITDKGNALCLRLDDTPSEELCIIDLNNKQYKEDFKPILSGCECLACKKHTRAYIHHLLNTREMLSLVLLSIHNLHHYSELFRMSRQHIASNTFQVFKSLIIQQYNLYTSSSQISNPVIPKQAKKVLETQINKKKRLLNGCTNGLRHAKGDS